MNDDTLTKVYHRFASSHDCFLDGILCDPGLRVPFVEDVREELGDVSEAELLHRLVYLRKRGQLARKHPR